MYNILGDIMNVREELFKNQDEKYGDFHSKLIPNIDRDKIIGVRLPNIRKIAKAAQIHQEVKVFALNSISYYIQ